MRFSAYMVVGLALCCGCEGVPSRVGIGQGHDENVQSSRTIGHRILELEAEIPGAPSGGRPELDRLIQEAAKELSAQVMQRTGDDEARAVATFRTIAMVLRLNGYQHRGTYPGALSAVLTATAPERSLDCDTGSFIYLSIADYLELPVRMVEVEVPGDPSGRGFGDHNFVRWDLGEGRYVDWDVNSERRRMGDVRNGPYGFAWTRAQLLGYVYFLRGISWREHERFRKAITDYERSIRLFPEWPKARNNLAWLLATVAEVQRLDRAEDALRLSREAVRLHPSPNYRDTLACTCALVGRFEEAIEIQTGVVADDNSPNYQQRLEKLRRSENCIGEK